MRPFLSALAAAIAAMALALPAANAATAKPGLHASVSRLDCGSQAVDAGAKACGTVTFTNTESSSIQIGALDYQQQVGVLEFFSSSTTCVPGAMMAAGESCTVDVAFNPALTGRQTAKLVLPKGDLTSSATVRLVGTGT